MSAYQIQLTEVGDNMDETLMYPINRKEDVLVGKFEGSKTVELPGTIENEELGVTLAKMKTMLSNLFELAKEARIVTSSLDDESEKNIASAKTVKLLADGLVNIEAVIPSSVSMSDTVWEDTSVTKRDADTLCGKDLDYFVSKDEFNEMVRVQTGSTSYSISANGFLTVTNVNVPTIAGYKAVGIIGVNPDNMNVGITKFLLDFDKNPIIGLKNHSSEAVSGNVNVTFLYAKTI